MNSATAHNTMNDVGSSDSGAAPTYSEAFPPLSDGGNAAGIATTSAENEWLNPKIQRIKSSVVTQIFHIPMEERAYKQTDFGQAQKDQSKACMDIMKMTDTQIEISTCRDGSLALLVSGRADNVLKARREIFNRLQTQARITINIPKDHHRVILGKSGSRLQKLELETATKINIPRSEDQNTAINIVGTQEGIHKAKHEIQLISDEQAKLAMERLQIEKMYHPFVSGPRSETSNQIAKEHGVRIHIPPPSVPKNEIVVAGEKDGVNAAVAKIMAIYNRKSRNCKTIAVEIMKSQHKYIIGPRGQTLQDILAETEVSVELPPSDSLSETVTLRGEPEKLGQALTTVYAKANSVVNREVMADVWLHRFIIGKKGANIRNITANLPNVNVEFRDEESKIVIEGPPSEVDQAQQLLEKEVKELKSRMDYTELNVDPKYHRNIIGKGGQSINKLRDQYKVNIRIPSDTDNSSLIRIEGDPEGVQEVKKQLGQMIKRMENERSKDVLIEHRFHKNIIGQKGENIRVIRERFPEVNISFPDASLKSDVVNLRGPKNEVDKCYKYLKHMNDDLIEKNYRIEVPIFKQYHKNVIGKGGSNIRKIREETNTQIELPTENSDSEVITIIGKKADCEKARKLIREIEREQANIVEESLSIESKLHNSLIGAKGRLIRSVMDECGGVQIHFPTDSSGSNTVTIRGPPDDVKKAKTQLLQIAKQKELASYTQEVKCKPELHRFLIGRGGATIKKVRDETGARIIFPAANDNDKEAIVLIGRKEEVEQAQKILTERIKKMENVTEIEMEIDPKWHKHFVARRAAVLRDIADEFGGVAVSFPRVGEQSAVVRIKGPSECVQGAKTRLAEIVDDLNNQVTIKCVIDEKYHRTVIGMKGKNIQLVTGELNIQVKFPDRGNQNAPQNGNEPMQNGVEDEDAKNIILITGHKDRCQEAKEALEALVPQVEEVSVPYKFHRYIIGQKGSGVRKLMEEFDVNIGIPPADKNSDIITITGTADKLTRAKEGLMERVGEIEKDEEDRVLRNFALTIEVPNLYHPQIIGRRGATITKIRIKNEVNIQFPDREDPNRDQIKIVGYERNTEAAKQEIMAIVNELASHISQDMHIDRRVHPRLIGTKGKAIRKIMEDYGVDIRFPKDKDIVTVTGPQDRVEECVEHVLNLEEEYMQDIVEQEENRKYNHSSRPDDRSRSHGQQSHPFVVRDAPWHQSVDTNSMDDFPSLSAPSSGASRSTTAPAWNRRM
ncbi:vigilin-like isoform X2 [Clavelina lepadiformis]|uniref:vigilin-like isoform X2 n=1 Tax=Clavelina lepadiformis TaxID=159417 RepID=UPI004041D645